MMNIPLPFMPKLSLAGAFTSRVACSQLLAPSARRRPELARFELGQHRVPQRVGGRSGKRRSASYPITLVYLLWFS